MSLCGDVAGLCGCVHTVGWVFYLLGFRSVVARGLGSWLGFLWLGLAGCPRSVWGGCLVASFGRVCDLLSACAPPLSFPWVGWLFGLV